MTQLTVQHTLELAQQHHQAGRLQEAEQLYRQILSRQPEHAVALHQLRVIAYQVGRNDVAVDLIRRAIAANPKYAEAHGNLGNVRVAKGQLDNATAAYREAIALNPDLAGPSDQKPAAPYEPKT
jgi:protein O-GlcNAc transferase